MADASGKKGSKKRAAASSAATPASRRGDDVAEDQVDTTDMADWQRRVVDRSLRSATKRSIDRGGTLIRAAAALLERSNGEGFTVQEVANEAGQSLRTLYQYFESKDDLLLAVFEEAMTSYAQMIRTSIAALDDPLERLAGAVLAAASMPALSSPGVDSGLARLRLRLGEVEPELVARSHLPVTMVFLELVRQAVAAGEIADLGDEPVVFMISSLNSSFIISQTLGNDYGLELPDPRVLARFCLQGVGAAVTDASMASIAKRLLPPASAGLPRLVAPKRRPRAAS